MTVTTLTNSVTYQGNGSTTNFTFPWAMPAGIPVAQIGQYLNVFLVTGGITTQLTYGNSSANYQASINAPVSPDPTPVGGTVTYNPSGGPIPVGTTITIQRVNPLTQTTTFSNQGTALPTVTETTIDNVMMAIQDEANMAALDIVAPVTDPSGLNYTLPAVAARAQQVLGFDASGNVTTFSTVPAGNISAAMAPVVAASSLALARTDLGLGAAATEGIGSGLEDDGSGNLRLAREVTNQTVGFTVTSGMFAKPQELSGGVAFNVTLPLTTGLWNGWYTDFYVAANTTITFVPNASDTILGLSSGTSVVVAGGSFVRLQTNAANLWFIDKVMPQEDWELDTSVSAGALTISMASRYGYIKFRDPTATGGDPIWRQIPATLSSTIPSGGTMAATANQAFKVWVGVFDNAGVLTLGVWQSVNWGANPLSVTGWDETTPQSSTALSASSDNAATWYTGTAVTTKSLRIIGYLEWSSGLATPGTWVAPTKAVLFGPGVKRPCDVAQKTFATNSTTTTSAGSTFTATNLTASISLQSAAHIVHAFATGNQAPDSPAVSSQSRIQRGATTCTTFSTAYNGANTNQPFPCSMDAWDAPSTTSSTAYTVYVGGTSSGNGGWNNSAVPCSLALEELVT
jgi:hypothetical protein